MPIFNVLRKSILVLWSIAPSLCVLSAGCASETEATAPKEAQGALDLGEGKDSGDEGGGGSGSCQKKGEVCNPANALNCCSGLTCTDCSATKCLCESGPLLD